MTDAQLVAIAITVLAVLGGTLVNNTRIGDIKEVLRAEMKLGFAAIDHKLDEILHIMGDHETRIRAIEQNQR